MITIDNRGYREARCKNDSCRKLLFYEYLFAGRIAMQCDRCGTMNIFDFKHLKTKANADTIDKDFTIGGEVTK